MLFLDFAILSQSLSGSASLRRGSSPRAATFAWYRSKPPCSTVMAERWAPSKYCCCEPKGAKGDPDAADAAAAPDGTDPDAGADGAPAAADGICSKRSLVVAVADGEDGVSSSNSLKAPDMPK